VAGFCFVLRQVNSTPTIGVAMINANLAHPTKRLSSLRPLVELSTNLVYAS